jgi:hypothetical protein
MPMPGLTRVNGAFYSFLLECEALTSEKLAQCPVQEQVPRNDEYCTKDQFATSQFAHLELAGKLGSNRGF